MVWIEQYRNLHCGYKRIWASLIATRGFSILVRRNLHSAWTYVGQTITRISEYDISKLILSSSCMLTDVFLSYRNHRMEHPRCMRCFHSNKKPLCFDEVCNSTIERVCWEMKTLSLNWINVSELCKGHRWGRDTRVLCPVNLKPCATLERRDVFNFYDPVHRTLEINWRLQTSSLIKIIR